MLAVAPPPSDPEEARWLEAHGADAIIAQGLEAGGHRGIFLTDDLTTQVGTMALLPQVVRAVKVPVIAAGGIAVREAWRRRVVLALRRGPGAARQRRVPLLCPEATITPMHRAALQSPRAEHTTLTNLITGRLARGMYNRLDDGARRAERRAAGVSQRNGGAKLAQR